MEHPTTSRAEMAGNWRSGLLEAHWLAGDLPGRHLQWTDLLGDFSFETFLEVTNPVLGEFGVIMHGRP